MQICSWAPWAGTEVVPALIPLRGIMRGKQTTSLGWGGYRSSQTGQTVNLLANAFQGANPCPPKPREIEKSRLPVPYLLA